MPEIIVGEYADDAAAEQLASFAPGQWGALSMGDGAAAAGIRIRGAWQQNGTALHAWVKVQWPGMPPVMVHATTDESVIAQEMPGLEASTQSGFFGLGKIVKKLGLSKVAKTVTSIAKKAINNPMIRTALMATPVGQTALMIQGGARLVSGALKGNLNAKNFINFALQQATAGNPQAQAALKLLRAGARQVPGINRIVPSITRALPQFAQYARFIPGAAPFMPAISAVSRYARMSGDEQWIGMCAGDPAATPIVDERQVMIDNDIDSLLTMATAGSFEGARYMLHRMALQPMINNPYNFGRRQALLLGRQAGAARFAG